MILVEKLDVFVIIYLDNIFIYIKNEEKGHLEGFKLITETLIVCQIEKMLVPSGRIEIFWLHYLLLRHLNGRRANQGYT